MIRPRWSRQAVLLAALPMLASVLGCGRPAGEPPEAAPPVPEERLGSAEAVVAGHDLFVRHCTPCHGARADGSGPRAARLAGAPADLTALPDERRDPRRLFEVLHQGLPGTDMPSWRALDDAELWDLVTYLRTLSPRAVESRTGEEP